jgi:hypothetical protein
MISKIELGDDVIEEIQKLKKSESKDELIQLYLRQIKDITRMSELTLSDYASDEIEKLQKLISGELVIEKSKVPFERKEPSERNSLTFFLEDRGGNKKDYEESMINLEMKIEKDLVKMFRDLDIQASVKTDRYSLPYTNQVEHTGYGESYLNAAFLSAPFKRKIVKELLDKRVHKIRFFVFAEIEDQFPMGRVNYYFNYYVH